MPRPHEHVERRRFGPYTVEVGRLDRVYFPDAGITKRELLDYYDAAAERLLPGLRDRAVSLQRFPEGIDGDGFYQKRVADYFPDWFQTVVVPSEEGSLEQVVVANRATLAYLVDHGTIAFHPWLSRVDALHHPDQVVLDLDPSTPDFEGVRRAAFLVRDLLEEVGLVPFVRTTGSRGVHVVAPLDRRTGFDEVRAFAHDLARVAAHRDPEHLTVQVRKVKRETRIFVDWLRNSYAQTAVASYSVRARRDAPVATPLTWEELADTSIGPRTFTVRNFAARLDAGDPWAGWRRRARALDAPRERLDAIVADEGLDREETP